MILEDGLVDEMLGCGDPEKMGYIEYRMCDGKFPVGRRIEQIHGQAQQPGVSHVKV
jgi:hypothetical protein